MSDVILKATYETLYMVIGSTFFAVILGFIPAIILTLTAPDGLKPNKVIYTILDILVNIFRSFPFVILMVIVIPLTRLIAGKAIGTTAALVPLTISAIPFVARVIESALRSVDVGLIEAAKSFGASDFQIIYRIYLKEAIPAILSGITLTMISIIGYSAMGIKPTRFLILLLQVSFLLSLYKLSKQSAIIYIKNYLKRPKRSFFMI